jgi:hypothetical protein
VVALALLATTPACGDAPAAPTEDLDVPLAELERTLAVDTLRSERTYNAFATEGGGFGQAGRLLKYFIDVRNGADAPLFINANFKVAGQTPSYALLHYEFARTALGITEEHAAFNDATYYSDDKRYIAGSLQTYHFGDGKPPLYAIQFYPDDVIHEEGILRAVQILKPRIRIPGARLAVVSTGPQQTFARVADALRKLSVEPMTIDEILGQVTFLPLNAGEAWGYLRIFPRDQGALRPTDIPVFEELPLDLSVVAGTITRGYQDVTSHVNLKSKERGTPNMMLRDASPSHPELAAFADQPVHFSVSKTGYRLAPSTAEEVEQKWRERTGRPWQQLASVDAPNLLGIDSLCPVRHVDCLGAGRFGGKAAGLGFLANVDVLGRTSQGGSFSHARGYDLSPDGFAVPVAKYRAFVAANPELQAPLAALIADERSGRLSPNERRPRVLALQALFYRARVPTDDLRAFEQALGELTRRVPQLDEVKVRSSSNAEDIERFDGAGLHDSFSVKLSAQDNNTLECFLQEDASGPVTKRKILPRTPQCAIKGVYASLWNQRAVEERSFARLDHASAGMGLAVVPAYDTDAEVVANGVVITRIVNGADVLGYTVSTQEGNNLVTNPNPGTQAETTVVTFSADPNRPDRYTLVRAAIPVAGGPVRRGPVLPDAKLAEVVAAAVRTERMYCATKASYPSAACQWIHMNRDKRAALDLEFKVLADGRVTIKQVREFHAK